MIWGMQNLKDLLLRYAEPTAMMASGAAAEPLAGLYGLFGGGADGVGRAREAMTYEPRSSAGKEGLKDLGSFMSGLKTTMVDNNPPVRMALDGYNSAADYLGDKSPALGAAFRTLPTAAGIFLGPGGAMGRDALGSVAAGAGKGLKKGAEAMAPKVGQALEDYMASNGMLLNAAPRPTVSNAQRVASRKSTTGRTGL
jgi:hypothetical protein